MPKATQSSSRLPAYFVHLFTASGACMGLLALAAITKNSLQLAFVWMGLAVFVDAIDGAIARKVKVKIKTPEIDGALLDMIVDFLNYVIVPAVFLLQTDLLPSVLRLPLCSALILLSALQFSHKDAKTEDDYFLGFPSYWNIVVFYLAVLQFSQTINVLILSFLLLLTPIPLVYLYPSKMTELAGSRALKNVFLSLTIAWGLSIAVLLLQYPQPNSLLLILSLAYVALYFERSFAASRKRWAEQGG